MQSTLTQYPPGSFREVWALSWPLMLAYLSLGVMLFTDRWYLAQLDCATLNASVTGGMYYWLMAVIPMSIAGVSEVIVGRYNGSRNNCMIGSVLWACPFLFALFVPLSLLIAWQANAILLYPTCLLEVEYFKPLALFLPFQVLTNALTGWFVGIGRVRVIIFSTFTGALVNILFDRWLIFGGMGIQAKGIAGAAIGTGLAQMIQGALLLATALRPEMRELYQTHLIRKHVQIIKGILKEFFSLGLPLGLGQWIEIIGHVFFLYLTKSMGQDQLTLTAMAQSIYMLLVFVGISVNKTAATICANAVGSRQPEIFSTAIRNCMGLIGVCATLVIFASSFGCQTIMQLFLSENDYNYFANNPELMRTAWWTLAGFSLFFLFDNTNWVMNGVLAAKADTRIIMWVNIATYWGVVICPLAALVHLGFHHAYWGWFLLALSTFLATCFYLARHKRKPACMDF